MNPCSFQALFPDEFLWNARKESFLCRQSNRFAELGLQPGIREEEKNQTDCSQDETVVRRKQEQVPRKLFFAGRAEKEIGLHAVGNIVHQCFHQSAQGKREQKQCGENGAQITGKVQRKSFPRHPKTLEWSVGRSQINFLFHERECGERGVRLCHLMFLWSKASAYFRALFMCSS